MTLTSILLHVAAFLCAPFLLGVINKTKAGFAGRHGPPVIQSYYDLWKLLQKGAVYSRTTSWVFRWGPIAGLSAVAVAIMFVPMGGAPAPLAFTGDIFLLLGLLGLARFAAIVAALDTGSSFEGMGASREAAFSAITEPALFLVAMTLALVGGGLSISAMSNGIGFATWTGGHAPALVLTAIALFLVLLAENSRIPVDDPNTHLELTMIHEVMVLDNSGPDLAYITYGASLKLWLFASVLVLVLLPIHTANPLLALAVYLGGVTLTGVAIGIVESTMARLRMVQVPQLLLSAGGLGALAVALALAG